VTGVAEKNANWHDTQTFRAALKCSRSTAWTSIRSIYVQSLHINDTGAYWLDISDPSSNTYYNGNKQRIRAPTVLRRAVQGHWATSWANIVSNTSYFSRNQHSISDYSQWYDTVFLLNEYPPVNGVNSAIFSDHQNNFNQEIRSELRRYRLAAAGRWASSIRTPTKTRPSTS